MDATATATVERNDGRDAGPGDKPAMLTVHQIARMLNCSTRTVYRLTDSGKMPQPVWLGRLVRWTRQVIELWISEGCPSLQTGGLR